jgi:hypothetical protein
MAVVDVATPAETESPQPGRPWRQAVGAIISRHRFGLFASLCYTLGGFWVFARLWTNVTRRLAGDGLDHQLMLWMLAHAARSVTHLENPLFSSRLNVPDGVNMMANTSILGLGIPMTPVTLLFGPQVSFAILGVLSLAGTAAAWYYVFSRRLVSSRPAAFIAGALCGFAPGMIAHAPGHMHMIAQFVLPFIVLFVLRLAKPDGDQPHGTVRDGVILGLLVTYQIFISEETLLLTALACAGLCAVYAVLRPREARRALLPFVRGLAVAGAVAGVLLAYPLWFQFLGPQHSHRLPFDASSFVTDALAYVTNPGQSVAGDPVAAVHLATNGGEENAFFGWPLVIVAIAIAWWLRRLLVVQVLAITGLVFAALSLGNHVVIGRHATGIPGPFRLLSRLPVFDMALPTRFSLILVPILAALLALAGDRVATLASGPLPAKPLYFATMAIALVPIAPVPLHAIDPPATPAFISTGAWRSYVPEGRSLVPVPLPRQDTLTGMRWAAETDVGFAVPRGYFIGPDGTAADKAVFEPPLRPTVSLLQNVAKTGRVPDVTERDRQSALADLRYWRAAIIVLTPQVHDVALLVTLDALLGPGERIDGAWVWDVRARVG